VEVEGNNTDMTWLLQCSSLTSRNRRNLELTSAEDIFQQCKHLPQ